MKNGVQYKPLFPNLLPYMEGLRVKKGLLQTLTPLTVLAVILVACTPAATPMPPTATMRSRDTTVTPATIPTGLADGTGPYFGQTPPGPTPQIFAPGIISLTDRLENLVTFPPDGNECFFVVWGPNFTSAKIFYTKRENNVWSPQVEAPFSVGHYATSPFFSPDGNKLYFDYDGHEPSDILMVQRTAQGWSDPQVLPSPINSDKGEFGYTETADGVAFFASDRPGGQGYVGIWRLVPGKPTQAESLGANVNSAGYDFDPFVAPDGSYLLFTSGRPGGHGSSDLYVIFSDGNGGWNKAVNMDKFGEGINTFAGESGPTISPDGRFLFFTRYNPAGGADASEIEDIYWMTNPIPISMTTPVPPTVSLAPVELAFSIAG